MVSHPRTSARPDHLRSLNQPQPLTVDVDRGHPVALVERKQRHVIETIQDTWIIEDEWWRDPISRQYFSVLLANGQTRTVYHDRITDTWFAQAY